MQQQSYFHFGGRKQAGFFSGKPFSCSYRSVSDGSAFVEREVLTMGALRTELRLAKGKDGPVITENGNLILDAWFGNIHSSLEKEIKSITGVVENGLFMGYDVEVMVAK